MKKFSGLSFLLIAFGLALTGCLKDSADEVRSYYSEEELVVIEQTLNLPSLPDKYTVPIPEYISAGTVFINDPKATLGRVLFYDPKLSSTNKVSCASCHLQEKAFSDPVALSIGVDESARTRRNSYAIGSTASTRQYYDIARPTLFWDSRVRTVNEQSTETIQNAIEMGMSFDRLIDKLNQEEYYRILFSKAYQTDEITKERILAALEEFVLSFLSINSRFDEGYASSTASSFNAHKNLSNFTDEENLGKRLFVDNCSGCHGQKFTLADIPAANNGLDLEYIDRGIGELTNNQFEDGVFKVPVMRNVELTAPYMHDGRFATLEDVIEHYSTGIKDHRNLHPLLKQGSEPKRFNFSAEEKAALVAFLKTLTDEQFIKEPRYSDPFR
ncbi:MAG: cytochrome c peroxidase [Bacteroidota bacterium]